MSAVHLMKPIGHFIGGAWIPAGASGTMPAT